MTDPPASPPPPGRPSPDPARQPDRRRLYDAWSKVMDEAKAKAAEERAPAPPVRRGSKPYVAAVLSLACVAAWGLAPLRSGVVPADPPEVRAAGLRVALYVVGKRIEGFRQANQRLPRTLAELGQTPEGVAYRVLDTDRFELVAAGRADTVVYHSSQPLDDFLGDAPSYFRRTGPAPR